MSDRQFEIIKLVADKVVLGLVIAVATMYARAEFEAATRDAAVRQRWVETRYEHILKLNRSYVQMHAALLRVLDAPAGERTIALTNYRQSIASFVEDANMKVLVDRRYDGIFQSVINIHTAFARYFAADCAVSNRCTLYKTFLSDVFDYFRYSTQRLLELHEHLDLSAPRFCLQPVTFAQSVAITDRLYFNTQFEEWSKIRDEDHNHINCEFFDNSWGGGGL